MNAKFFHLFFLLFITGSLFSMESPDLETNTELVDKHSGQVFKRLKRIFPSKHEFIRWYKNGLYVTQGYSQIRDNTLVTIETYANVLSKKLNFGDFCNEKNLLQEGLNENLSQLVELINNKSQQTYFQNCLLVDDEYQRMKMLQKFIQQKLLNIQNAQGVKIETCNQAVPAPSFEQLICCPKKKGETLLEAFIRKGDIESLKAFCSQLNESAVIVSCGEYEKEYGSNEEYQKLKHLVYERVKKYQLPILDYVNESGEGGETPLHIACAQKTEQAAKILVEAGANLYAVDDEGYTPFQRAIINSKPKIVKYFMQLPDFDITKTSGLEESPLQLAVERASAGVVDVLHRSDKFDVNEIEDDLSLLHRAVMRANVGVINSLLSSEKLNKDVVDNNQYTALDYALKAEKKNNEVIIALLKGGVKCSASLTGSEKKVLRDIHNSKNIFRRFGQHQKEYLNSLVNPPVVRKKKKKKSRQVPSTQKKVVKKMPESPDCGGQAAPKKVTGAKKKQNKKNFYVLQTLIDSYEGTREEQAIDRIRLVRLKQLLHNPEYKSQIDAKNGNGHRLLERAIAQNKYQIVKCLIEAGADIGFLRNDPMGIMVAFHFDNADILKLLIDSLGLTRAQIFSECKLLFFACRANAFLSAKLLIEQYNGRQYISAKDEEGEIPLHQVKSELLKHYLEKYRFDILLTVIKQNNIIRLSEMLADSAYKSCLNEANEEGKYLVQYAVRLGLKDVVKTLIDHGTKVDQFNTVDTSGIFFFCINEGHEEIFDLVLNAANFSAEKVFKDLQLLHPAVYKNRLSCVEALIDHYGSEYINVDDADCFRPIDFASDEEIKRLLKKHGAKERYVKKKPTLPIDDSDAKEYFFHACRHGLVDLVKTLLENKLADIAWRDSSNYTPLHVAAATGNPELVKLLIQHGADKDAATNKVYDPYKTPMVLALENFPRNIIYHDEESEKAIRNYLSVLRCLIRVDNPNYLALETKIAFYNAISDGEEVLVEELLKDKRIDFNWSNEGDDVSSESMLHVAVGYGQPNIVKLLTQYGFPVNKLDAKGRNALAQMRYAITNDPLLDILLDNGIKIKNIDNKGRTVLWEILKGELPCFDDNAFNLIRRLVEEGVPTDVRDNKGETVLDWMIRNEYDYPKIFNCIALSGSVLLEKNADGKTVLQLAKEYKVPKIRAVIEKIKVLCALCQAYL